MTLTKGPNGLRLESTLDMNMQSCGGHKSSPDTIKRVKKLWYQEDVQRLIAHWLHAKSTIAWELFPERCTCTSFTCPLVAWPIANY